MLLLEGVTNHRFASLLSPLSKFLVGFYLIIMQFFLYQVNLVVNYDLPVVYDNQTHYQTQPDNEVYLHRIGRAGRFGRKGMFLIDAFFLFLEIYHLLPARSGKLSRSG